MVAWVGTMHIQKREKMRFIKIFLAIILLFLSITIWMDFHYKIEYFFGNPPKEKIEYLKKEVSDNNITAIYDLMIFYANQRDDKMFKKYYSYRKKLFIYCREHKDKCKK